MTNTFSSPSGDSLQFSQFLHYAISTTVEPQSYGLHSYGKLGQLDTEIEYIFDKYHQNFYKMGTGRQV